MIGWLLDTLVYSGLLLLLVLVLRRPAARLFGPQVAYGLWALPFLRLLLPPIVLPASFAPKAAPAIATMATHAPGPKAIVVIVTQAPPPVLDWPAVALLAWLGGALAFLVWRSITYRWMRQDLLEGARTVGEIGNVRLVETPAVDSPVAFGVRDKVIALPQLFMAQPDLASRDLAIAHELEHHRGRDLAANFAAQALLGLHWFNPLAWIAWRAMRRDQEAACDARVLNGRGREDRARYAELIAGTAAGRRLALAAPMACPVLGDASIVHRLRSLAMSDISPRRRRAGRLLIAGGALALPLTASFSYAHAQDDPLPPAPPAPPAVAPPLPAPPAPEVRQERRVQRFGLRTDRDRRRVRDRRIVPFVLQRDGDGDGGALAIAAPRVEFRGWANPAEPEYQKKLDEWSRQMGEWGRKYGEQWRQWGNQAGQHAALQAQHLAEQSERAARQGQRWADYGQRFALARPLAVPAPPTAPQAPLAPQIRIAPVVIEDCSSNQTRSETTLSDGRRQVTICRRAIHDQVLARLRRSREGIVNDRTLSEDTRRDALLGIDQSIEHLQRDDDRDK